MQGAVRLEFQWTRPTWGMSWKVTFVLGSQCGRNTDSWGVGGVWGSGGEGTEVRN